MKFESDGMNSWTSGTRERYYLIERRARGEYEASICSRRIGLRAIGTFKTFLAARAACVSHNAAGAAIKGKTK